MKAGREGRCWGQVSGTKGSGSEVGTVSGKTKNKGLAGVRGLAGGGEYNTCLGDNCICVPGCHMALV